MAEAVRGLMLLPTEIPSMEAVTTEIVKQAAVFKETTAADFVNSDDEEVYA
jgi:hypothetical protein